MGIVGEWESHDKSSFILDVLINYVDDFVVESIRHDLEKKQKEHDDSNGWIYIGWEDDEGNMHGRGGKVLRYTDDEITFVDPTHQLFTIPRSCINQLTTTVPDHQVAIWDNMHESNTQKCS